MAVKKKEKAAAAGAPEWMVTYGDMVTLLLTFFVLLLSMSEVKKKDRVIEIMQASKETIGHIGGVDALPTEPDAPPVNEILKEILVIPIKPERVSETDDEGVKGAQSHVTAIRPGEYFAVGAPVYFEELSDEIPADQIEGLKDFAGKRRGFTTQFEIRGHCGPRPVDGTAFKDHLHLSFSRAYNVANALVDMGFDPRRLIVIAAGSNEPVNPAAYSNKDRQVNDVVEIMEINRTVDEFEASPPQ